MQVTSSAFMNNQELPQKYGYHTQNISPPLDISGLPNETKSLVLIVHDPDAPVGDFTHWLLWDIPPTTTKLIEGTLPTGVVQGTNDFGDTHWDGPAPPNGTHHYHFMVYALDTPTLGLPETTHRAALESTLKGHVLATAELIGLFTAR